MRIYCCLIFWPLELIVSLSEVFPTEKAVKGCLLAGPFFNEEFKCIKSWQTEDETGKRLGDGTTCWHRTLPTGYGLKCSNGMWKRTSGSKRNGKRAIANHFTNCPGDQELTAPPATICANATWDPPSEEISSQLGGDPGDCFPAGKHVITYDYEGAMTWWTGWDWSNGDTCSFNITVTVHHCSTFNQLSNGYRYCDLDTLYGSVCTHSCNPGYRLTDEQPVTCVLQNGSPQWSTSFPTCEVLLCSELSEFSNGNQSCSGGDTVIAFGSTCYHQCDVGYRLNGAPSVQCTITSGSVTWNTSFPVCESLCSWPKAHCWPGDCSNQSASSCVCRSGFMLRRIDDGVRCELDMAPNMYSCRVSLKYNTTVWLDANHTGNSTHCQSEKNDAIQAQPSEVYFVIGTDLNMTLTDFPRYVSNSSVGIVDIQITLMKVSIFGKEQIVSSLNLNGSEFCEKDTASTSPPVSAKLECEGTLPLPSLNLTNGESFCVDIEAYSGGFYTLQDDSGGFRGQFPFTPIKTSKRTCFLFDNQKPIHCFQMGCSQQPLEVSTRTARTPNISIVIGGWTDPDTIGEENITSSHIDKYRLEVHYVVDTLSDLSVQDEAILECTIEWRADKRELSEPYNVSVFLPRVDPCLYAFILAVHDFAGNVGYARRFVMFDNSSSVESGSTARLNVTSACTSSDSTWQLGYTRNVCVDYRDRYYISNTRVINYLRPVSVDTVRGIYEQYDQRIGILPVNGTVNVHGVVRFEIAWGLSGGEMTWEEVKSVESQTACVHEDLLDGDICEIRIRAFDIIGNIKEDSISVNIDHSDPEVKILGEGGRFGRDGLHVNNAAELSEVVLLVLATDPHSGIHDLRWELTDIDVPNERKSGIINVTVENDCSGREYCYCPKFGSCETYQHYIMFSYGEDMVSNINNYSSWEHHYSVSIFATNYAGLSSAEVLDIFISPTSSSSMLVLDGLIKVSPETDVEKGSLPWPVFGAALGIMLLIAVVVAVPVFICKRRRRKKSGRTEMSDCNDTTENTDVSSSSTERYPKETDDVSIQDGCYDTLEQIKMDKEEKKHYSSLNVDSIKHYNYYTNMPQQSVHCQDGVKLSPGHSKQSTTCNEAKFNAEQSRESNVYENFNVSDNNDYANM